MKPLQSKPVYVDLFTCKHRHVHRRDVKAGKQIPATIIIDLDFVSLDS